MIRISRRNFLLALIVTLVVASWAWSCVTASAAPQTQTSFDQIGLSYEIPITNPANGDRFSSVLLVESATLSTKEPDGSGVVAPPGKIFLTMQMTSGAIPPPPNSVNQTSYFDGITPLAGTALQFDSASGHHYVATRINPVNWNNFMFNTANPDGLVDATYYFVVPISTRRGTLVILPSHTIGYENVNLLDGNLLALDVGGPTKIPLSFPRNLTIAGARAKHTVASPSSNHSVSSLNFAGAIIFVALVLLLNRRVQRWRRRRVQFEPTQPPTPSAPRTAPTPPPSPNTSPPAPTSQPPTPRSDSKPLPVEPSPLLRVDVLGRLTISPTNAPASDPVRAIIAYLAMNSGRLLTLEEIQNAVWPLTENGTDIKRPVMRNYMAEARKVVGDVHLPSAAGRAGYELVNFTTDWREFQALAEQAAVADGTNSIIARRQALSLVRGTPFTADTTRYFTWAQSTSVLYEIVRITTSLAHHLSTELVLANDLAGAEEVLRQGLLVDPASLILWEDLTDVLLENADQSLLRLHWRAAELVLRPSDVVALRKREHG